MMPDGWNYHKLGELGTEKYPAVKAGPFGSSLKKEFYTRDGFKIYGQEQVISGDPHYGNYFINEEKFEELKSCAVKPGDILISLVGTIGRILIIPENAKPGIINPRLLRISVAKDKVYELFLKYYLEDSRTKHKLLSWAQGGTMGVLNAEMLKALPVPIPPLSEQKKIARILSTWDKAIETVEKLIENSQAQKKALMQQLLTGKRRLPGFDDGWLTYKLSEIFHFKKGKGLSKGEINSDGKYKCILYGELYTKYAEIIHTVASRTNSNNALNSAVGDVLIPCSTTTSGIDLANTTCLQESNVLLGGDITVLRPKNQNIDPEFVAYLLTHVKKHEIARLAQGITIIHLYGRDLKNIAITLPGIIEQKEIVKVMKNSDKEIDLMNVQLNHLQDEKKALMQQLLTGKRRVQTN